ncbi:MAG: TolC family protein [Bacteroidia bacterium]|nr:TolC family protein [Bacteroidia bacterium]
MKAFMTALILLVASVNFRATAQHMTLEDAVAIGLENNYSIRIARNSADIAMNTATFGTSALLPTLDASASGSLLDSRQQTNSPFSFGDSETRSMTAQLSLNWTLFDGFRMFADRNRYHALARLGEEQARAGIEAAVTSIARAYFSLVQQQQLELVLRRSLEISAVRLEKERVRRELGGSLTTLLTAEVAYASDSLELLQQQLAVDIARQELNLNLGRPADTPCEVTSVIDVRGTDKERDELFRLARERNAALRIASGNLTVAQEDVTASRSGFLPRLGLFATWGYSDRLVASSSERFSQDITTQSADATVGLNLSLNLFNGLRNSTELQNAELVRENRRLLLEEARLRVDADLRAQLLTLDARLEATRLSERNLDAARRSLDLHLERYNTGVISSLEFRDAQLQYVRAEAANITARYLARVALIDVQRTTGDLRF